MASICHIFRCQLAEKLRSKLIASYFSKGISGGSVREVATRSTSRWSLPPFALSSIWRNHQSQRPLAQRGHWTVGSQRWKMCHILLDSFPFLHSLLQGALLKKCWFAGWDLKDQIECPDEACAALIPQECNKVLNFFLNGGGLKQEQCFSWLSEGLSIISLPT